MTRLFIFGILCLLNINLLAQTFKNTNPFIIPDDSSELLIPIDVSGLPTAINQNFGLTKVCLAIQHDELYSLSIKLKSPNNQVLKLSEYCGWGDNLDGVCFQLSPALEYICESNPPYSGEYYPQQSLNIMNHGQNPNGLWYLSIRDVYKLSGESVCDSITLTFSASPEVGPVYPCSQEDPWRCLCPDGKDTCDLLPDMTASEKAMELYHTEYIDSVTLSNATPNIGWGPIEIHGKGECYCDEAQVPCEATITCPDGHTPHEKIIQRVYRKLGDTIVTYDRDAGFMHYHPSHGHIHLDHWSNYTLRRKMDDNLNASQWPIVGRGNKVSFCLINLSDCDDPDGYCVDAEGNTLAKNDIPNHDFGSVEGCENDQGIYVGNVDIYDQGLPDQSVYMKNICNGEYYLVSITDPENNILETDDNNNWAATPITLSLQNSPGNTQTSFTYDIVGNQVSFTNLSPPNRSYYWEFGDGTIDTSRHPIHTYTSNTTFDVKLHALDYCFTSKSDLIDLSVDAVRPGVSEITAINVYPNPVQDNLVCNFYSKGNASVRFEILNSLGTSMIEPIDTDYSQGMQEIQIDLKNSNIPNGFYFLKVTSGKGQHTMVPVVKE